MRVLPYGRWDFLRQLGIWLGFAWGYEVARALARPSADEGLRNASRVIDVENHLGGLWELHVQRLALDDGGVLRAVNWTYWVSQFVVVSTCLLWVYLRRHHAYMRLRNTLFAVNTLGLVGYVALPTAPPRLVPGAGFVDTLAGSGLSFSSGLVSWLANPYAAMPSLHAADALVIAVAVVPLVGSPVLRALVLLWPPWVWFCLLASGNHFWLDVAAGIALAAVGSVAVIGSSRPEGDGCAARDRRHGRAARVPERRGGRDRDGADPPLLVPGSGASPTGCSPRSPNRPSRTSPEG